MRLVVWFFLLSWSAVGLASDQQLLKRGNHIIKVGDPKRSVFVKLGKPSGSVKNEYVEIHGSILTGDRFHVIEEYWFYNFGSSDFTVMLEFENHILVKIKRGFYGFDVYDPLNCQPPSNVVQRYQMIPEVIMTCGEPDYVEVSYMERTEKLKRNRFRKYEVRIEEWTYNYGPDRYTRILRFENGVLVDAFQGERGWQFVD